MVQTKTSNLKTYVVVTSVNELTNIMQFKRRFDEMDNDVRVIIVDEGSENLRKRNTKILQSIPHAFYGPKEREQWFKQRFGSSYQKYLEVIPERCHAENSFGFLVAYEDQPDMVIEIDDDVFPVEKHNLIAHHANNLLNDNGITVQSNRGWYNTLENLRLNQDAIIFPRGHPYNQETRTRCYTWTQKGDDCVLNMGLWTNNPDFDALTILYHGGLDGRCNIKSEDIKRDKVIVGKDTFIAVCSMNTSLLPKIIPAFYQMYMNYMGIDRFDDIWSGIFLKKIVDHLGDKLCLGSPVIKHNKSPRSTFKDLKKELNGIIINEKLWKIVYELELQGKTYWECYHSLIDGLERNLKQLQDNLNEKFMLLQIEKMRTWLEIVEKLD